MSEIQYTPKEADDSRLDLRPSRKIQKKHEPILLRLNRRAVIFFGLQTIALILYYISGNIQFFLEVNMKIVLRAMTISSIALALFCAAGIVETILFSATQKTYRLLFKLIPYGIVLILATTFAIFSRTVDLLSLGYMNIH